MTACLCICQKRAFPLCEKRHPWLLYKQLFSNRLVGERLLSVILIFNCRNRTLQFLWNVVMQKLFKSLENRTGVWKALHIWSFVLQTNTVRSYLSGTVAEFRIGNKRYPPTHHITPPRPHPPTPPSTHTTKDSLLTETRCLTEPTLKTVSDSLPWRRLIWGTLPFLHRPRGPCLV